MLNRSAIVRGIADMCRLFTVVFLVPIPLSFAMDPWNLVVAGLRMPSNVLVFLASAALCTVFWMTGRMLTSDVSDEAKLDREGYLVVGAGWLVLTVFCALPFYLSGVLSHPIDALFEAMSGLTTTGSSVLKVAPEAVDPSILFWRALLQWIGGLGIIVLLVALLANLTQGGFALMKAEAGAHAESRLRPKLADTAKTLGKVYIAFSVVMIAILFVLMLRIGMAPGDALYDAVYHTFTTYSTGGFSSHADSIAFYQDPAIEAAIIVIMLTGATQFLLFLPRGRRWMLEFVKDPQWRFMMGTFVVATVAVTLLLMRSGDNVWHAFRGSSFAVATSLTGTGLAARDFSVWAHPALVILLLLMLTGGNAGSTAGGLKSGRVVLLAKTIRVEVVRLLHPRAVVPVRMGGRVVKDDAVRRAVAFFFAYITIWVFATILIGILEPEMGVMDAASTSVSAIGNVGIGIGAVGPSGSFADLTYATKSLLGVLMWVGRLEIFTAILLFYPSAWKH